MSYAEHGSRIFLTGKLNPNPLSRYGEYVVPRKRSEGRLKLFDSCTDLRAWSPNAQENCRYFRDIVENPTPSGRIVPYDVLIESLILLGQTELASVRCQLEKYKALRLTPEQERQLQDIDDQVKEDDSTLLQESITIEDESGVPKRPGTPIQSICSSSSNFQDIEIDTESFTDNSDRSKEVFISSQNYEDADLPNETSRHDDRSLQRYRSFEDNNHQGIIIKKDSEIIALENQLGAKEAELEEMREICRNLESSLNEKESMLNNLRTNLNLSQNQLLEMGDQLHQQKEESKKKLYTSMCFVDHLKSTLAEKSQECTANYEEIQELRERMREIEAVRQERDSLSRKLDEMKIVQRERNDLITLNKQQAINLEDQEDEINRLLQYIEREAMKYAKRNKMKMKCDLEDLRSELEAKNSMISHFETQSLALRPVIISPTESLTEVPTFEIRKFKQTLQEELEALENELAKREKLHEDDNCRNKDEPSRLKNTIDRINEATIQRDNWERDKELMECTIEQLTMQVSASNAANEEQEKIVAAFSTSRDKIQRLIVELEPFVEERSSLIEKIQYLNEALEDAKRISESQEITNQKQYLSNLVNKHKKESAEYTKKIASLEKKLEESRKECTKLSEKVHREKDDIMHKEIDNQLLMFSKRSIKTIDEMMKVSAGLRGTIIPGKNHSAQVTQQDNRIVSFIGGAGDEIGREMAKKQDELEAKNVEIAKLREHIAFNALRVESDLANNKNLEEIARLKKEKKLLEEELMTNRDSLTAMKNELQSSEFKLKGAKQKNKDFQALCKQKEREIQMKIQRIERLEKENEGLNKTVLITNDLAMEGDEMKIKLDSLQGENSKLMDENSRLIKRCADYENRLIDLTDKELQAKEAFDQAAFQWQELILKRESEYEFSQSTNENLVKELEENKLKIAKLTEENKSLRKNTKKLDMIENWTMEISKLDEDRQKLHDHVASLRRQLENDNRFNDKLEEDLRRKLIENETLENTIGDLKKNIEREKIPDEKAKKLLQNLPNEICEQFETFRKQLKSSDFEDNSRQREIDEWKAKSLEDSSLIEKLRDEIKFYKNKIFQQDKTIIGLEESNVDLMKKLEKLQKIENLDAAKLQLNHLENKTGYIEMEIAERDCQDQGNNEDLKNLAQRVQLLMNENNELGNQLKNEKDLHRMNLTELQKKYQAQERNLLNQHNDSVKEILAKYEEITTNTSNPFDPETWLNSLTMKEKVELQKRLSSSTSYEVSGEATKSRAHKDKQNQQLQQEEKLQTDKFFMKNGHQKDEAVGLPYMYERRKFESAKHKPVEGSLNDNTFDTQRMNFIHQCAIQHKYDSSH